VLEATRAALDYLQFLANEFDGDWLLAMAAYNAGEYAVARAIERNQAAGLPTDFFSLPLPRETRAYVPKLLAVRRIVDNPAAYNLSLTPIRNQPYFTTVDLPGQLDLNVAAELAALPKDELLALNPAFNHIVTDPQGPHRLLLPITSEAGFIAGLSALPPQDRIRLAQHRVLPGETLTAIARQHRLSVQTLMAANNLASRRVRAGQVLVVSPIAPSGMSPTLAMESRASGAGKHRVRPGETLWSIAQKYDVSVDTLMASNRMRRGSQLRTGAVLKIPRLGG
jgi:membrane-bound lytic murein transglycosylase D